MKIDFKEGTMGENDRVVLVDGEQITMLDFAEMAIDNMNVREASGLKPDEFMIFLNNCIEAKKVTDELLDSFFHTKTEEEMAQIAVALYNNEEIIKPREQGMRGGEYFRDFLNECLFHQEVTDEIIDKYKLR